MSNQYLKLRRSNVPDKIPTTESIDFGEIALNTFDGKAYMKVSGSDGIKVVPIGSNSGSFSGDFTGTFSGSFSGSGANLFGIPASGIVGLNLSQISSGSYSASISENGLLVNTRVVADSFTGSLFGTASWAENVINASNIYNTDGTLTGNRSVNIGSYQLNIGSGSYRNLEISNVNNTGSVIIRNSLYISGAPSGSILSSSYNSGAEKFPQLIIEAPVRDAPSARALIKAGGWHTSTWFGAGAMDSWTNTGGAAATQNDAFGWIALGKLTTGFSNTAFGAWALGDTTTGERNVAVGLDALWRNTTGIRNTGIGNQAGQDNISGSRNIYIGDNAGRGILSGSNNIIIGTQTGLPAGLSNNIIISVGAGTTRARSFETGNWLFQNGGVFVDSGFRLDVNGSTRFGSSNQMTVQSTGQVDMKNGLTVTGSLNAPNITGSLEGTASWARNAITASYVLNAVSASHAETASYAQTASYLINAKEFYYTASAPSGSFITTGSLWIDSDSGYMFAYIDDGSDKVWIQPTVEGEQGPIGLTGPQGPVGPQGPTGSSQPFSFVGNDTWATTSSLQVTGSLTISGSSTFTNIGPAAFIGSVSITGSTTQTGNNTLIGNTTLSGSINVSGSQTFYGSSSFYGAHLLSGSNTIRGNTFMFGNIQVSGSSNFNNSEFIVTGSTSILGDLNVKGTSVFSNTTFTVTGSQYFTGSSFINGNQSLTGNSTVTGSLNVIGNINVVSGSSFTRWGNKLFNYGIFSDTTTQTGPQNTILSMSFNTTDIGGAGVSVVDNTKITVDNTGIYNLQFSAQFDRTTSGTDTVTIWFAYTGSSIPNSATDVLISGNAANNPVVASWNYVLPMSASSYVEIYWSHNDNQADKVELKAISARTGPVRPAVPSVIATLTQIA